MDKDKVRNSQAANEVGEMGGSRMIIVLLFPPTSILLEHTAQSRGGYWSAHNAGA